MKLIIAGGRDYILSATDCINLNSLSRDLTIDEVVSGCARGTDLQGEIWAISLGIPIKRFPANWKKYGKQAGFMRNSEMAQYADGVVLFPGGKGTEHMRNAANAYKLLIYGWH